MKDEPTISLPGDAIAMFDEHLAPLGGYALTRTAHVLSKPLPGFRGVERFETHLGVEFGDVDQGTRRGMCIAVAEDENEADGWRKLAAAVECALAAG